MQSDALFRASSDDEELEEPPAKKTRFFADSDSDDDQDDALDLHAVKDEDKPVIPVAGPSKPRLPAASSAPIAGNPGQSRVDPDWDARYFGDVFVEAFALASCSSFVTLKSGEAITLHRIKPKITETDGKKSAATKKKFEHDVVRFKNTKGIEVGRIARDDGAWLAKLLDHDILKVTGYCVACPEKFRSGDDIQLSLSVSLKKTAFTDPNIHAAEPTEAPSPHGKKSFLDDLQETEREKLLRERKKAFNILFDKADLQPYQEDSALRTGSQSKRAMLDRMEKRTGVGDDEEEDEMSEIQLNLVYSKAIKNDANLPERDPPDTFSLTLRPYQKQALRWMAAMETGEEQARKSLSMHPLWEKYLFPGASSVSDCFYYNPYSGEISLDFPKASTRCRGGILADEMGLGKTIMVASLIHTNTAWNAADTTTTDESAEDSEEDVKMPARTAQTQARLAGGGIFRNSSSKDTSRNGRRPPLKAGTPRATLVVAPMTLISQWCDELERSSKGGRLRVLMYYGNKRESASDLQQEIEEGVDVVVTSYGTLCSDFKQSGLDVPPEKSKNAAADEKKQAENGKGKGKGKASEEKKKKKQPKRKGLFAIDWFRIVLDEAHLIKSRTTLNAKASYALKGARRWALTGTPIVNRLEDLYSLLHYIQLEPWGNFSFFKTFVTVPFQNKDPRAIEVIQVILESILLRREKKMRDKDGNPIVALPEKHVDIVHLDFTKEEREIYNALFQNAKSKFLGYAKEGTVMQNVTAIFSILMRLRQAVLHPSLVLKRLKENLRIRRAQHASNRGGDDDEDGGSGQMGQIEDVSIQRMIERYIAGSADADADPEAAASQVIDEMLDVSGSHGAEPELGECMLCMEPVEVPVWMPVCHHVGCKGCVLQHLTDCQDAGEPATCPMCGRGPLTERDIAELQKADGKKPVLGAKKSGYSVDRIVSSPGSSSSREVLTLLSSDDEDGPPSPKKDTKGKGKAKVTEITLDSDSEEDDVGESDDYMPSSPPPATAGRVAEDALGDLASSDEDDDDDDKPGRHLLLSKGDFRASTKLDALIKSLQKAKEEDPKLKAVVFSQFTGFLDLIERSMNRENLNYLRLDGAMAQGVRQKVVRKFTTSDKSVVLLASLKAGGVGLNLIAGDHVYLMDTWWNSAVENQAIDRIHRFGQTREVYVTRFLIKHSIDDKMIALQERKTKVIQGALGGSKDKDKKQLAEDLAMIFADDE
ncbi:hypothetical protein JCM10908_003851 [Rhodotorula pacifica]|uniref:uncharacterized protein n=1 Tax=Rhodotorula pacifica TaxID=1495444 RepID=UPI00317E23BF